MAVWTIFRSRHYIISLLLISCILLLLKATVVENLLAFRKPSLSSRVVTHPSSDLPSPCRSDRTTHAPNGSAFARETADPLTPGREPQCIVGTDAQRIMGKEVKEEQNRLKGCAVSGLSGSSCYCWRDRSANDKKMSSVLRRARHISVAARCETPRMTDRLSFPQCWYFWSACRLADLVSITNSAFPPKHLVSDTPHGIT